MFALIAQRLCLPGGACIEGPAELTQKFGQSFTIADIINRAVIFLFPIAGLILFINILRAGFGYLTSSGDPKKMEQAKGRLTTSLIGFAILFLAFWITQIVAFMFGIEGIF